MDVEEMWADFKQKVKSSAENTICYKYVRGARRKQTPYWTGELKEKVKEKNKAFRTRTEWSRRIYVKIRNETLTLKRKCMEESWIEIGAKLEDDFHSTKKLLYNLAKQYRQGNKAQSYTVKDVDGELLTDPKEIDLRWKDYFKELLNGGATVEDEIEMIVIDDTSHPIMECEVKEAIGQMKKKQSSRF